MTKKELIKEIKDDLATSKKYRKVKAEHWKSIGIDLDEVDAKLPSSEPELTNSHRNDAAIRQMTRFLDLLKKLD